MKGIFFNEKQDIGAEHQPIDMAYNELIKKNREIRGNMPINDQSYRKYYMDDNFALGGVVKTKKGNTMDAKHGGTFHGRSHDEGGIKAVNVDTDTPIEVEGGEVVITKDAVADTTKREFMGKQMTNKEILSYINQSGGGVALKKGGEIYDDGGVISEGQNSDFNDQVEKIKSQLDELTDDSTYNQILTGGLNEQGLQEVKNVIELLERSIGRMRLELSLLSPSMDDVKFNELARKLSKTSTKLSEYRMMLNLTLRGRIDHFLNSLNETGNAFNIRTSDVPINPKKIDEPFNQAIYSEEFKDWFGDWELARETKNYVNVSKAVDANGFPEIYFHGGRQYQTTYRPIEQISVFYWAQNFEYAKWFAENAFAADENDAVILRAYVNCRNPIDLMPLGYREIDLGTAIRYVIALYPQTNLRAFLPSKFKALLKKNEPFGIKIRAWQLIRQFNPWVTYIRDQGVFDGFMYEENNPSHIINGKQHTTKAFAIFRSNQIKFPNQTAFNSFMDDFRFEEGGILI